MHTLDRLTHGELAHVYVTHLYDDGDLTYIAMSYIVDMSDICDMKGAFVGQERNERMREARREAGLSQAQLAKNVGVARQTICSIEAGDYNPTLNLCKLICKALGKTLDQLFWD